MIDIRDNPEQLPDTITLEEYTSYRGRGSETVTSWYDLFVVLMGSLKQDMLERKVATKTTFCGYGKRNALKQSPNIQDVQFICDSYENLDFENTLIYCVPPYQKTTEYRVGDFEHEKSFEWCCQQSKKNIVFVSEYNAPEDFDIVWEGEIKAVERLFKVR